MKKQLRGIIMSMALFLINATPSFGATYIAHTVQPNESLFTIAKSHNTSVENLKETNFLSHDEIYAGQVFHIRLAEKNLSVFVNGQKINFDVEPYIENGRTFVPIRYIAEAIHVDCIDWDETYQQAILVKGDTTLRLPIGSKTIFKNTTTVDVDAPITTYQSRTFVPLRFISEVFDCEVRWEESTYSIYISSKDYVPTNESNTNISTPSYSEEDLYWLSRIVEAEAKGEPYEGKLGVANCVINRKKSPEFPNTIKGVVFDRNYGYQYTPVANGTIYNNPSADSIRAAKEALSGKNNVGRCMYFLNPRKSTNFWILRNRTFYCTIQNHDFYL
ncbi:MAG: LysM peptidoglycan-binding domain-containing protein [Epulopiscium sp.]|nr:LysM peptidoglycan-binding domain-containing protein [Candidatus Epulonipiscium sp.]